MAKERKSNTMTAIKPLTNRPSWKALAAHHTKTKSLHLRKLFATDPKRGTRLTADHYDALEAVLIAGHRALLNER